MKVVGLQRSGTNYLEQLLRANFHEKIHLDPLEPFFKHSFPEQTEVILNDGSVHTQDKPCECFGKVIVIRKERDKWIESIKRNPADLEIKHPEIYDNSVLNEAKARVLWRKFYEAWEDEGAYILDYKDLLYDFDWELDKILKEFLLSPKYETYVNFDKVPHSDKFTKDRLKYYLQ